MKPQNAAVLALLRTSGRLGITPNMARERVGTDRLAARIAELRADGHHIETTTATFNGKHFARYVLHEQPDLSASQRDARPGSAPAFPVVPPAGARRGAISPLPGGG